MHRSLQLLTALWLLGSICVVAQLDPQPDCTNPNVAISLSGDQWNFCGTNTRFRTAIAPSAADIQVDVTASDLWMELENSVTGTGESTTNETTAHVVHNSGLVCGSLSKKKNTQASTWVADFPFFPSQTQLDQLAGDVLGDIKVVVRFSQNSEELFTITFKPSSTGLTGELSIRGFNLQQSTLQFLLSPSCSSGEPDVAAGEMESECGETENVYCQLMCEDHNPPDQRQDCPNAKCNNLGQCSNSPHTCCAKETNVTANATNVTATEEPGEAPAFNIQVAHEHSFDFSQSALHLSTPTLGVCPSGVTSSSGGCWTIAATYKVRTELPSVGTALYLPKRGNLNKRSDFPCDYDIEASWSTAQSACCLKDFRDQYLITDGINEWIESFMTEDSTFAIDETTLDCPDVRNNLTNFPGRTNVGAAGFFEDGSISLTLETSVQFELVSDNTVTATIVIPDAELHSIGQTESYEGGDKTVLFVGLLEMVQTGTRYLDVVTHQVPVAITKNDRAIFASVDSGQEASFLNFAYARVHTVLDTTGLNLPTQYYASISFAVTPGMGDLEDVIDPASLTARVAGKEVVNGNCLSQLTFGDTKEDPRDPVKENVYQQSCAPHPSFCSGKLDTQMGFATLYVPLMSNDPQGGAVEIEFVIQLGPSSGATRIFEAVKLTILTSDGTIEWCSEGVEADIDLTDNWLLKIYSGITTAQLVEAGGGSLDNPLEVLDGAEKDLEPTLASGGSIVEIEGKAHTASDGLLTLTAEFSGTEQNVDSGLTFAPVLEEMFSVHLYAPDSGSGSTSKRIAVQDAIKRIKILTAASGDVSLDVTGLDAVCADSYIESIGAAACAKRHDVRNEDIQGSYNVLAIQSDDPRSQDPEGQKNAGGDFVANIAGPTPGNYALNIGKEFHQVVQGYVSAAHKKAWWINPGYEWTLGDDGAVLSESRHASTLSTDVYIVAMFRFDIMDGERTVSQRRLVQTTGVNSVEGMTSSAIRYDISQPMFTASIMQVAQNMVTGWNLQMEIADSEACIASKDLVRNCRSRMLAALSDSASQVKDVHITGITVDMAGVRCPGAPPPQRRLLFEGSGPVASVKALFVFDHDPAVLQRPFIDVAAFEASPGMVSLVQTQGSPAIDLIVPPSYNSRVRLVPLGETPAPANAFPLYPTVGAIGFVMLFALGFIAWRWTKRDQTTPTEALVITTHPLSTELVLENICVEKPTPSSRNLDLDDFAVRENELRYGPLPSCASSTGNLSSENLSDLRGDFLSDLRSQSAGGHGSGMESDMKSVLSDQEF